jgi:murein L,D-transpeptidase YcbB/YkuD
MRHYLVLCFFCLQMIQSVYAQPVLNHTVWVERFYKAWGDRFFWMGSDFNAAELRAALIEVLQVSDREGVLQRPYQLEQLVGLPSTKGDMDSMALDRLFTDAALSALMDHRRGFNRKNPMEFDAVSSVTRKKEEEWAVNALLGAGDAVSLFRLFGSLEPIMPTYRILRQRYAAQTNPDTLRMLKETMNLFRWIDHFRFDRFIVIDRSTAELFLYEHDTVRMQMRVVLGKEETPTPTFAAWAESAILYPYWYVPASIFYKECVGQIIRNRRWLDWNRMEVVDGAGGVIDPLSVNWPSYRKGGFPYTLRQRTGCDNSLGIFKIDIQTPFSVYLHDTNNRGVFVRKHRYLSHGCIRLENPIGLGQALLGDRLDVARLRACLTDQKPDRVFFSSPLPVFLLDEF